MKRLNKLLISTLSLSAIVGSTISLAACNKTPSYADGVEVTKDEWNDALAYIAATVEGASWKSSTDDLFELTRYNSAGKPETVRFNNLAFNDDKAIMHGTMTESGTTINEQLVSIAKSKIYFTYSKNEREEDWNGQVDRYSIFEMMFIFMIAVIGGQDGFTFDTNTKAYIYNDDYEYEEYDVHSDITIRFDSNKKITYVKYNSTLTDKTTKVKTMIIGLNLHPKYSDVKVDVPEELITRANEHTLEMSGSTKKFNLPEHVNDGVIVNVVVDNTYTKITGTYNGSSEALSNNLTTIYKNGKLLVGPTDYRVYLSDHKFEIEFNVQLQKNDKISFGYSGFPHDATELTIALSN